MEEDSYGRTASRASLIELRHAARLLKLSLSLGARSVLAGQHGSRFRGRGMDYAESRHYQPGDDVRNIDWKVTARTGVAHTKLFIEERERPVFIMVDFSPSLFFGTRDTFKSVLAARGAALLAWTALHNGDRIGGVIGGQSSTRYLRPRGGRQGVLRLISELSRATRETPDPATHALLDDTLEYLSAVVHPGSLVILFSDFLSPGERTRQLLSLIRRHNDVVMCQLLDPIEISAPPRGLYGFRPLSGDGPIALVDTRDRSSRGAYERHFSEQASRIESLCTAISVPLVRLVNGEEPGVSLAAAFGGAGYAPETATGPAARTGTN